MNTNSPKDWIVSVRFGVDKAGLERTSKTPQFEILVGLALTRQSVWFTLLN